MHTLGAARAACSTSETWTASTADVCAGAAAGACGAPPPPPSAESCGSLQLSSRHTNSVEATSSRPAPAHTMPVICPPVSPLILTGDVGTPWDRCGGGANKILFSPDSGCCRLLVSSDIGLWYWYSEWYWFWYWRAEYASHSGASFKQPCLSPMVQFGVRVALIEATWDRGIGESSLSIL